jgi:hypothetical protein
MAIKLVTWDQICYGAAFESPMQQYHTLCGVEAVRIVRNNDIPFVMAVMQCKMEACSPSIPSFVYKCSRREVQDTGECNRDTNHSNPSFGRGERSYYGDRAPMVLVIAV